jgi:hypothetical protein
MKVPSSRRFILRAAAVIAAGMVACGVLIWCRPEVFSGNGQTGNEAGGEAKTPSSPLNAANTSQASGLDAPSVPPLPHECSFATVRIDASGHVVIAGHAEPAAVVKIRDGRQVIGEASADALGDWLVLAPEILNPGTHLLALEATRGDEPVHSAPQKVVLDMIASDAVGGDRRAVAVLVPSEGLGASTVLQALDAPLLADGIDPASVAIDLIDYSPSGIIAIGGRAVPGAVIVVSVGDRVAASVDASPQGLWHVDIQNRLPRPHQTVHVDYRDAYGQVVGFSERTVDENAGIDALSGADSEREVAVMEGPDFTRIARRVGRGGVEFSVVYQRQAVAGEVGRQQNRQEIQGDATQSGSGTNARTTPTP